MTFRCAIDEIRKALASGLESLGYSDSVQEVQNFDISEPARKEYGDLACNIAFPLSKKYKKRPFDIANEIVEKHLKPYVSEKQKNNESSSFILSAETHASGYINFRVNFTKLAESVLDPILDDSNFGLSDFGHATRVLIEHTSVNPNKALHIGHVRNMVIGDCLYRIMKATNHNVAVLNYIDDSGLQVADIVVGFKFAGFSVDPEANRRINRSGRDNTSSQSQGDNNDNDDKYQNNENKIDNKFTKFDHYCDEVYVKVNELYKTDKSLEEKRQLVLSEIEKGTSDIAKFSSEITMRVLKDQLKTSWRMKSRYDLLNFESQIIHSNLWMKSFDLLKEKDISRLETSGKNNGCWILKVEGEEDKVVVRSNGTATYIAKDIPYAAWKLGMVNDPFYYYKFTEQWDGTPLWATTLNSDSLSKNSWTEHPEFSSADVAITITDVRQDRLQRIISKILGRLRTNGKQYYHLGYESVSLSSDTAKVLGLEVGDKKFIHMSGRKGINIDADDVLERLHNKAHEEVRKRNPDLSSELSEGIAEEIAVSALRYNLIKQDLGKMITFDIFESLNLEGDTGPYLQYAYARSLHILQKSDHDYSQRKYELLTSEPEHSLIKELAKFDIVLEQAVKNLDPRLIAKYAYTLATEFNLFYEKVPVLREKDPEIMHSRLVLVKAFGFMLKKALNLLGVAPLDKM
ncbi:MAG TPA: arginine--tRNA ligase [Nitrososphaeraceae archaeon]|nr:arginine--tRNA ligase [Nitrososphaeraceae archaeon]